MVYELTFNEVDLGELALLLDDLFLENSLTFERLVSALSRIGLRVSINSVVSLYPTIEVAKQKVVSILKKGLANVQKK